METARVMRNSLLPIFSKGGVLHSLLALYNAGARLLTMCIFAYMCAPFQLLDLKMAWDALHALYFAPHFVAVGLLLVLGAAEPVLRKLHHKSSDPVQ